MSMTSEDIKHQLIIVHKSDRERVYQDDREVVYESDRDVVHESNREQNRSMSWSAKIRFMKAIEN